MSGLTQPVAGDESLLPDPAATADELRERMVQDLLAGGNATSPQVLRAMAVVPRHLFVPDVGVESAYAPRTAITTKRGPDGLATSSASSPSIVARMLEQLGDVARKKVLEIGTATGYNAALIAEMVGGAGEVVSIEIDPELAARAARSLQETGYGRVDVVAQDGSIPLPGRSGFDAIIVTAAAWEVHKAWFDQLRLGGKLVVPLRWCGQTQSVEFVRDPVSDPERRVMRARTMLPAGFIPLVGEHGERPVAVWPDAVTLVLDDAEDVQVDALSEALRNAPVVQYSGEFIDSSRSVDRIALRLAAHQAGTSQIVISPDTVDSQGFPALMHTNHGPAVVRGGSIAYVVRRSRPRSGAAEDEWDELGSAGFGEYAEELNHAVCSQIVAWGRDRGATPSLSAYVQNGPPDVDAGRLLRRTESYLHITM